MPINYTIVTIKHYQQVFNLNYKTASIWYHDDLAMLNRKRLTMQQFDFIYGDVSPLPFKYPAKKLPKTTQKPPKKRHLAA